MRHLIPLAALSLLSACGSLLGSDERGPNAGITACRADELNPAIPSSHVLAGESTVTRKNREPVTLRPQVELYYPEGRVADAPVIVAHRREYLEPKLIVVSARLTKALGFGPVDVGTAGDIFSKLQIEQRDASTPPTFRAEASIPQVGTGSYETVTAEGQLCSTGQSTRPGEAELRDITLPPAYIARWQTTVPIDTRSFPESAELLIYGTSPIPGHFEVGPSGFSFTTEMAFPPNVRVELKVDGLRDVIGRPISIPTLPRTHVASWPISDLTFTEAPPEGAISYQGGSARVDDGVLRIGLEYYNQNEPFHALVALPYPGGAKFARIRARMECGSFSTHSTNALLISSEGTVSKIPLACSDTFDEVTVWLPSPWEFWLAAINTSERLPPGVTQSGPRDLLLIDEITFE